MSNYSQLLLEERCSIARLGEAGQSIRQIAAAPDRQPPTIARALKHNSAAQVGYRPAPVATREQPGHREADAMLFSAPGQAILVAHERWSRLTIGTSPSTSASHPASATPEHPGRKAAAKTQSESQGATSHARQGLHALPDARINDILALYNHRPRKCPGFQTPAEVFICTLPFQGEAAPGSSRGDGQADVQS